MKTPATYLKCELNHELNNIMEFWHEHTQDATDGGFYGKLDHYGKVVEKSPKGVILNTRILWAFSATSIYNDSQKYIDCCKRSFNYIKEHFYDNQYHGVYWEVDHRGNPINKRKQIYGQAFAIYALSEYYSLTKDADALNYSIGIYKLIEEHAHDELNGGYFEAFDETWSPMEDVRLSEKDMNALKTMNTHLHIIEAYTSLIKVYKVPELECSLHNLISIFLDKFLNQNNHFNLFFDENWRLLNHAISYGHDIESAWLVTEGARALGDKKLIDECEQMALRVANTFLNEAIDADGAVINEKEINTTVVDDDRHWWVQVEAMIGLVYANNILPNIEFMNAAVRIWDFTKANLIDNLNGEWHFRVDKNGKAYTNEDKVSMWKAPYHTSRACIMINNLL